MNNLQLINTKEFNGMICDVYDDGNRIYMTRKQIPFLEVNTIFF